MAAFEAADVIFIEENGEGPRVQLKWASRPGRDAAIPAAILPGSSRPLSPRSEHCTTRDDHENRAAQNAYGGTHRQREHCSCCTARSGP